MRDYLRPEGYPINRKRVQRLMRKMGIKSVAPSPNTSRMLSTRSPRIYSMVWISRGVIRYGVLTSRIFAYLAALFT
ncbi:IS3 family transposase [Shewanella surugensis]|uniref:IS3 family transposase n=1 Tax=Shewanella surugensis TaxID=212020 RepID=UPI0035D579EB